MKLSAIVSDIPQVSLDYFDLLGGNQILAF